MYNVKLVQQGHIWQCSNVYEVYELSEDELHRSFVVALRAPAYTFTAIFIHVKNPCKGHVSLNSSISKPYNKGKHVFFNGFNHELLSRGLFVAVGVHSSVHSVIFKLSICHLRPPTAPFSGILPYD